MRLLIISNMPHHLRGHEVVGWGATVRELDHLATRFERVRHVAALYDDPAPDSAIPYTAQNIELVPIRPSGAEGVLGKLDVLRSSPAYIRTIQRELREADVVHVRAPANIALVAMVLLGALPRPRARWFKYAGNWQPDGEESPSYAFQRWWLTQGWHRGLVTVNGEWPDQPKWVRTFFNPSLTDADLERGREVARAKSLGNPLRLVFVGRLETPKGAGRAIEIVGRLLERGVDATLDLVGNGAEHAAFERRVAALGLAANVRFLGWLSPAGVQDAFTRAHVQLLPTTASEGWPKVLSEGMAYGVVPVAGAVSSIPQYLTTFRTGSALPAGDLDAFAAAIARYASHPEQWVTESQRAVEAAHLFSFRHYLGAVDQLLADMGDRLC